MKLLTCKCDPGDSERLGNTDVKLMSLYVCKKFLNKEQSSSLRITYKSSILPTWVQELPVKHSSSETL